MENSSPVEIPPEPLVEQHEPGAEALDTLFTGYYYYDPLLADLYPGDNDQSIVPGWFYYDPSQTGGGSDWPYRGVPPRHMLYDPSLYEPAADTNQQPDAAAGTVTEARGTVGLVVQTPEPESAQETLAAPAEPARTVAPVEAVVEGKTEPAAIEAPASVAVEEPKPETVETPPVPELVPGERPETEGAASGSRAAGPARPEATTATVAHLPEKKVEDHLEPVRAAVSAPATPQPVIAGSPGRRDTPFTETHEPVRADPSASDETVALSSFSFLKSREAVVEHEEELAVAPAEPAPPAVAPIPTETPRAEFVPEPTRGYPAAAESIATAQADLLPAESLTAPAPVSPSPEFPAIIARKEPELVSPVADRFIPPSQRTPAGERTPVTPELPRVADLHPVEGGTRETASVSPMVAKSPTILPPARETTHAGPSRTKPFIPGLPVKSPEPAIPQAEVPLSEPPGEKKVVEDLPEVVPAPRLTLPEAPERTPAPSLPTSKLPSVLVPRPGRQSEPAAPTPAVEPVARVERDQPALRKVPTVPPAAKPAVPSEPAAPGTLKSGSDREVPQAKAPLPPVREPSKPAEPGQPVAEAKKPVSPAAEIKETSTGQPGTPAPVLEDIVPAPAPNAPPEKPARVGVMRLAPISRTPSMTIQARPPMTPIRESAKAIPVAPGKLVLENPPPPPGKVEAVPMQFQPRYAPAQSSISSRRNLPVLLGTGLACLAVGFLSGYFLPKSGGLATSPANTANVRSSGASRPTVSVEATASPADGLTKVEQAALDKAFTASKSGNLPEALKLFSELQKKHPEWPSMTIEVGRIHLYDKDMTAAHDTLTAAAEGGMMPADANFLLGLLYMTNRSFPEAEAGFARANAIDPSRPDFYYFWGECLRREGKPLEAIDRFRSAMLRNQYETADGLYRLKFWLSKIQSDQEDTEDTAQQIDNGLKSSRPPMEALFAGAACAIKAGQLGTAADLMRKARLYVEPAIYAVIMQDPTFAQESTRPELAEFYKVSAATSNNAASDGAAAAMPTKAASPGKGAGSSGKSRP